MATATRTPPARTTTTPATETTADYFRNLFQTNPKWLTEPNQDVLAQWQLDHPAGKLTPSVRTTCAKMKTKLGGGKPGRKRKVAKVKHAGEQAVVMGVPTGDFQIDNGAIIVTQRGKVLTITPKG